MKRKNKTPKQKDHMFAIFYIVLGCATFILGFPQYTEVGIACFAVGLLKVIQIVIKVSKGSYREIDPSVLEKDDFDWEYYEKLAESEGNE